MKYTIKAHPTMYKGVQFRSRLEARWAAFFDVAGWGWEYEPFCIDDWLVDFRVEYECSWRPQRKGGSYTNHTMLIEVKPVYDIKEFDAEYIQIQKKYDEIKWLPDAEFPTLPPTLPGNTQCVALFGINPTVTSWEDSCFCKGGRVDIVEKDWRAIWVEAGNRTMYKPPKF